MLYIIYYVILHLVVELGIAPLVKKKHASAGCQIEDINSSVPDYEA